MPFDPRTSSWISGSVQRCPQGRPEFYDTMLMTSIIDFIVERCWDRLGFEYLEQACERPTLSLVQLFLSVYYEHLIKTKSCTTCNTPFSASTFIKLVGVPSLEADKPYKVFLVHRYHRTDGDVTREILCYPEKEEQCYLASLTSPTTMAYYDRVPKRNVRLSESCIPVAKILPMPRDRSSVTESQQSKLLTLYNQHREERTKRMTQQYWMPKTIFEELEPNQHRDNISLKPKPSRIPVKKRKVPFRPEPSPPRVTVYQRDQFRDKKLKTVRFVDSCETNETFPCTTTNPLSLSRLSRDKAQYNFIKPTTKTLRLMFCKNYVQSCLREASLYLESEGNAATNYTIRSRGQATRRIPIKCHGSSFRTEGDAGQKPEMTMSKRSLQIKQMLTQKLRQLHLDDGGGRFIDSQ